MMTDPIADMLSRLRNAISARHARTEVPASRVKAEIARILVQEGYLQDTREVEKDGKKYLSLTMRYGPGGERAISGIERVSRSGCRIYVGKNSIPKVLGGLGISIISTPQGMMTGGESQRRGLGGEVVCNVW